MTFLQRMWRRYQVVRFSEGLGIGYSIRMRRLSLFIARKGIVLFAKMWEEHIDEKQLIAEEDPESFFIDRLRRIRFHNLKELKQDKILPPSKELMVS